MMDVSVEGLRYTYHGSRIQDRTVLDIAEWTLAAGEQVVVRGISGSGKTTLLNVLAGLLPPPQGKVVVGGEALYALSEVQRDRFRAQRIGYVFQTHLLVATLSALENVEMPLVFAGVRDAQTRRRRARAILDEVGLAEFARHRPVQLSTGQRQRVGVARALVAEPKLILADEPTAALDAENGHVVMDLLRQRARQTDATLVVASHDPTVEAQADRVFDLYAGRLTMRAHASRPATPAAEIAAERAVTA
jgi:putative ABC transport system ATP-binding protein